MRTRVPMGSAAGVEIALDDRVVDPLHPGLPRGGQTRNANHRLRDLRRSPFPAQKPCTSLPAPDNA